MTTKIAVPSAGIPQSVIDAAKTRASTSGLPAPVVDNQGRVAYYVDPAGNVVNAGDQPAGHNPKQTSEAYSSRRETAKIAAREKDQQEQQQAQDQVTNAANAVKLGAANQLKGWVWVNGHRAFISGFAPDGTPIVSYEGGKAQTANAKNNYQATTLPGDSSAFGAVNALHPGLNDGAIFNMSSGPADIFSGQTIGGSGFGDTGPNYTPAGVGMTGAAAEYSQSANTVGTDPSAPARNQMTVAQGVQWFLNLSVQHPDVYKHLLDQLTAANYLTPSEAAAAKGGYSNDAAAKFALATMDLAQINTTDGGKNLGLLDFLNQKQKAAQDAARQAAQPVTRNFQDPATLAYAARNAAQSAIGRNLTPAEEAAFEQAFRGKENAYYSNVDATNQAQAAAGTMNQAGPANSVPAPDTTGQAEQYLQGDQFGTQRAGYSMLEYLKAFQNFLGAGHL